MPPGVNIKAVDVQLYSSNVLVASAANLPIRPLPATFDLPKPNSFPYSNEDFYLSFTGIGSDPGRQLYRLGAVRLQLKSYSNDPYPRPSGLLYSSGGNSGTLLLEYAP